MSYLPAINARNILDLGDHLKSVFFSTAVGGREQGDLSSSGAGWEALICWYMNLCLLESRTVVIKYNKNLIPLPIKEAITVKYGTIPTTTESDLIAITFPDKPEYTIMDKFNIVIQNNNGEFITTSSRNNKFKYNPVVDALVERDFNECEIGIIQCKTNWNDNAQIPMLWDMIYSSLGFSRHLISIGTSAFSIRNVQKFSYSFVTVPTIKKEFKPDGIAVQRVHHLSGGNYWGLPTLPAVASSVKEIFGRNFASGSTKGLVPTLNNAIPQLGTVYSYFNLV
ncbi:hypothetical protein [Paenibacillus sp. MSJ-34]|uniref:hypothetical protein n=1 Tax=Paenibacillus sp. MSJ-34 TaxID=2841529 RepID=UPI001C0F6342|nr:hypothetical protein [Paenibacillus sp. MSJ-34]MBU5444910.1 hypothetical protein [Paenibacillus sp. MSJ-34]